MRLLSSILFLSLLSSTPHAHGIIFRGDIIITQSGTTTWTELIGLPSRVNTLTAAYLITTSCIIGYLIYEKLDEETKLNIRKKLWLDQQNEKEVVDLDCFD